MIVAFVLTALPGRSNLPAELEVGTARPGSRSGLGTLKLLKLNVNNQKRADTAPNLLAYPTNLMVTTVITLILSALDSEFNP